MLSALDLVGRCRCGGQDGILLDDESRYIVCNAYLEVQLEYRSSSPMTSVAPLEEVSYEATNLNPDHIIFDHGGDSRGSWYS